MDILKKYYSLDGDCKAFLHVYPFLARGLISSIRHIEKIFGKSIFPCDVIFCPEESFVVLLKCKTVGEGMEKLRRLRTKLLTTCPDYEYFANNIVFDVEYAT